MQLTNDLLSKILTNDNPSKIQITQWQIVNNIIPLGNNHCTVLSRLIVEYQKKGKQLCKTFILKVPSAHPAYNLGIKYEIYDREYLIYTEILELMYHLDGKHIGPRLYHADTKNSMMLKDLSQSGYKMLDRTEQLDFEHCNLVFKQLAKFHALSVKLHYLSKIPAKLRLSTWMKSELDPQDFLNKLMHNAFQQVFRHLDDIPFKNKLLRIASGDFRTKLSQEVKSDEFAFNVLNHGDCWNGNLMFKCDKYGCVEKVKLIDFQHSFWTSPACDILNFTITSMQFEVFENHFHLLLDQYAACLNKTLSFLHCNPYEKESFERDLKQLQHYVIAVLFFTLPEMISSHENPLDYKRVIKNDEIQCQELNKIYSNELYLKILRKWLHHFEQQGLFD